MERNGENVMSETRSLHFNFFQIITVVITVDKVAK